MIGSNKSPKSGQRTIRAVNYSSKNVLIVDDEQPQERDTHPCTVAQTYPFLTDLSDIVRNFNNHSNLYKRDWAIWETNDRLFSSNSIGLLYRLKDDHT